MRLVWCHSTATLVAVLIPATTAPVAPRARAGAPMRFVQFNVCGSIWSASVPMIVAGDFNRRPARVGRSSDPQRGGGYVDIDASRSRPTRYGKNIDYIFLDRWRFADPTAQVRSSPYSDHRVLLGEATLRN